MRKLCLVLLLVSAPLFAQTDDPAAQQKQRLLKMIEAAQSTKSAGGTVQFSGMKQEAISSFSLSAEAPAVIGGGGGGAGKVTFSEAMLVKPVSASSSQLLSMLVTGKHVPEVTVELTDDKGTPIARWKFSDVLVTKYEVGNGTGSYLEGFGLTFAKVDYFILIGL